MDADDELSRMISLESPEEDPDHFLRGVEEIVDQLGQLDDNISESRKLDIVLGGFTANYAVAVKAFVRLCAQNDTRSRAADRNNTNNRRWKDTALVTTGHKFKRSKSTDRHRAKHETHACHTYMRSRRGTYYEEGLSDQEAVQKRTQQQRIGEEEVVFAT